MVQFIKSKDLYSLWQVDHYHYEVRDRRGYTLLFNLYQIPFETANMFFLDLVAGKARNWVDWRK